MISPFRALGMGLRGARQRPRLVLGIFAINLVLVWFATLPFRATFAAATEMRPFADPLASGMKFDILGEIFARRPDVLTAGRAGALSSTVAWIILNWFLVAGVLGILREPVEATTLRRFGAEAAAHGFAMMRLQLWSLLAYLVPLILIGLGAWGGWEVGAKAINPWWAVVGGCVGALPGLGAWLLVATAVDVARARTVLLGNRAMASNLIHSFELVREHPGATLGVQFFGGCLWLGVGLIYWLLTYPFGYRSAGAFALLMLLRELTVLVRTGIRIGSLGGTLEVVRAVQPSAGTAELVPAASGVD